ncbi:hypothetical protein ACFVWY_25115 [Streptomyces sp. NPDC058195]|uniref:hypothetical protein n=1 Tax=Streptomyces sp. NPDC058195 TaxID=3346375 RepID=UPI0036E17EF1
MPLAPMMPDTVLSAFGRLRAVEADGTEPTAGSTGADRRIPAPLTDTAERVVAPVAVLCGTGPEPCGGSFARL